MIIQKEEGTTIHKLVQPLSSFTFTVEPDNAGVRIDIFLAKKFSCYSRSFFQRLIESSCVQINNAIIRKQGIALKIGDSVQVTFPAEPTVDSQAVIAKSAQVTSLYQGEHFLVIAKPADLAVHKPKANYPDPTLVDWLNLHYQEIATIGYIDRPGIVHRLDKDTSGLMLIARTNHGHALLSKLFKDRAIQKTYIALVHGHPPKTGSIDLPIGRHPHYRTKMTTGKQGIPGLRQSDTTMRDALTNYQVLHYFDTCSLVHVKPVTGRTHQIRVHFAAIGHPLLGDLLYGNTSAYIPRQALHAYSLSFTYNDMPYSFTLNPPEDFINALNALNSSPNWQTLLASIKS